jgi:hypothetical protein
MLESYTIKSIKIPVQKIKSKIEKLFQNAAYFSLNYSELE